MIRERKTRFASVWYRFGEPIERMAFTLPGTLREAVKEEAGRMEISASAFITDLLVERLKETDPRIAELNARRA
jgi:hypothetical protein